MDSIKESKLVAYMRPPEELVLTEGGAFFLVDRAGGKGSEAIIPIGFVERHRSEVGEFSHGFFQSGFILDGNNDE